MAGRVTMGVAAALLVLFAGAVAADGAEHAPSALSTSTVLEGLQSLCRVNATSERTGARVSVPYATGCMLALECEIDVEAPLSELLAMEEARNATQRECDPLVLLATVCGESPLAVGCRDYDAVCGKETESPPAACAARGALPYVVQKLSGKRVRDHVQDFCVYHSGHTGLVYDKDGVSRFEMTVAGRKLLHSTGEAHSHDHGDDHSGSGSEPEPPHMAAAHEVCVSCVKTGLSDGLIAEDCPEPLPGYAALCADVPNGIGLPKFDKICDDWRGFCERFHSAYPDLCAGHEHGSDSGDDHSSHGSGDDHSSHSSGDDHSSHSSGDHSSHSSGDHSSHSSSDDDDSHSSSGGDSGHSGH